MENLSDVVFALCLTMLVAVPTARAFAFEYDELLYSIRMLPAFLVCFLILIWIWYQHYKFFRRYGLGDWLTVALNTLLLFVVVSYTLPLRFVFAILLDPVVGLDRNQRMSEAHRNPDEAGFMMSFYGCGFVAIFLLLVCMHLWAWRRREDLQLDQVERYATKAEVRGHLLTAAVGVLSLGFVWLGGSSWRMPVAGMVYALLGPIHMVNGIVTGVQLDKLQKAAPATD